MAKWITFEEEETKGITKKFKVISKEGSLNLGTIKWYSAWRKYVFFPEPATLFETDCLNDITQFMKELMDARKKVKESLKEMKHIKLFEEHSEELDLESIKELIKSFDHHSVKPGDKPNEVVIRFNTLGDMDKCQEFLNFEKKITTYVDDTNASLTIKA